MALFSKKEEQPAPPTGMPGMPPPPGPAPEPKKEGLGGLFGKHKAPEGPSITDISAEVNTLSRRLRLLEEHYTNIRRKTQVTDQNVLGSAKKTAEEIRTINSDISDLRRQMSEIENKILIIIKEIKLSAKKEDVDVLQKYINLWQPVNFVTRDAVEKIVKEMLEGEEQNL